MPPGPCVGALANRNGIAALPLSALVAWAGRKKPSPNRKSREGTSSGSGELGGLAHLSRSQPSLSAIFLKLMPDKVLQDIPAHQPVGSEKGEHVPSIHDIRQYHAVRIYLQGVRQRTLASNWPLPEDIFGQKGMGQERYQRLQRYWVMPSTVKLLNEAAAQLVSRPKVVTSDEKLIAPS